MSLYDPIFFWKLKKKSFKKKLRSFDKNSAIEDVVKDNGYYFLRTTLSLTPKHLMKI